MLSIIHNCSERWRFEANVNKCAVVVIFLSKSGKFLAGGLGVMKSLPISDSCRYLRIEFSTDGSWDKHIKLLKICNRQMLDGLYRVLQILTLDLSTRRHILMAVLGPSLEYSCDV